MTRREAKKRIASLRCAGQTRPPVQRIAASPSSRLAGEPHSLRRCRSAAPSAVRRLGIRGSAFQHRADDFRDHITGAAHDHGIADAQILARQLVEIVQRGIGHRGAADEHRLQARHRRQRAGAPDLQIDRQQCRQRFFGRKLVRDCPARRARHVAELALPVEAIDLVDHAVDVVRQLLAQLSYS